MSQVYQVTGELTDSRHVTLDEPIPLLHPWPLRYPTDWVARVNTPETEAELEAVRLAVERSSLLFLGHARRDRQAPDLCRSNGQRRLDALLARKVGIELSQLA